MYNIHKGEVEKIILIKNQFSPSVPSIEIFFSEEHTELEIS
jgi:hypothetical protein